jgi:hypothetical protein
MSLHGNVGIGECRFGACTVLIMDVSFDMMKLIDQILQNKLVHSARLFYLSTLYKACVR